MVSPAEAYTEIMLGTGQITIPPYSRLVILYHNYTHFQEDLRGVEAVGGEPGEEGAGERGEELPHPEGTLTEEVRGTTEVVRGTIQMQIEVLYRSSQGRRKKNL